MRQTMTIRIFYVLSHLLSFECEDITLGGDFNLVLDVQNDKKGGRQTTHKNSLKEVQNIIKFTRPYRHLAGLQSGYQKIHLEKKQARNALSLRLFLDD